MKAVSVFSLKTGDFCLCYFGRKTGFSLILYIGEYDYYDKFESFPIKVKNATEMNNRSTLFRKTLSLNPKAECFLLTDVEYLLFKINEI